MKLEVAKESRSNLHEIKGLQLQSPLAYRSNLLGFLERNPVFPPILSINFTSFRVAVSLLKARKFDAGRSIVRSIRTRKFRPTTIASSFEEARVKYLKRMENRVLTSSGQPCFLLFPCGALAKDARRYAVAASPKAGCFVEDRF